MIFTCCFIVVRHMMYGYGDVEHPAEDAVNVLDDIVVEYITEMVSIFIFFFIFFFLKKTFCNNSISNNK